MTTEHVLIAASLDGFIARKDHFLDWLPQEKVEGEDPGYDAFIESVNIRFFSSLRSSTARLYKGQKSRAF